MKIKNEAWICSLRIALFVSIGFGSLASLLYFIAGFTSKDGRLAVWNLLYSASWPASWAANQISGRLEGKVPEQIFGFVYTGGLIAGGMIWFFLITYCVKYFFIKRKTRQKTN